MKFIIYTTCVILVLAGCACFSAAMGFEDVLLVVFSSIGGAAYLITGVFLAYYAPN